MLDFLGVFLSLLFHWGILIPVFGAAYFVLREKLWFKAFVGASLTVVFTAAIKYLFAASRPLLEKTALLVDPYSYPSGHSSVAFFIAFFFGIRYPKTLWISLPVATLVALSRVYLGLHYFIDIIGGIVLGILVALLIYIQYEDLEALEKKVNKLLNRFV